MNTKYNYDPNRCDGHYCCGNCWWCKLSPDHDGELDDPPEGNNEELIKRLRERVKCDKKLYPQGVPFETLLLDLAADAIEDLSAKVESLQFFEDNISKLPDRNTCLKKNLCEFMPGYGEYCRINCPAWLGQPPEEE